MDFLNINDPFKSFNKIVNKGCSNWNEIVFSALRSKLHYRYDEMMNIIDKHKNKNISRSEVIKLINEVEKALIFQSNCNLSLSEEVDNLLINFYRNDVYQLCQSKLLQPLNWRRFE